MKPNTRAHRILVLLNANKGGMTQGAIGKALDIGVGVVSLLLKDLRRQGHCKRIPLYAGAKLYVHVVTVEGEKLAEALQETEQQ